MVESPGRILSEARKARGGSLQEYADKTKIPLASLEALEADNWSWMAAPIYVKGFIRSYAIELDLDPEPLVAAWRRASNESPANPPVLQHANRAQDTPTPSYRWAAGIAVGAIAFVVWLVLNSGFSPRQDETPEMDDGPVPMTSEDARNNAE